MKLRRGLLLGFLLGVVFLLAWPATASAHANLVRSEPLAGSANATAPTMIRIVFSETPELKYCTIKVYDANGQSYDQGALQLIPGEPLGLAVAVRTLPQGVYTVSWRSSSAVDGHSTAGSFAFSVGTEPPPLTAATTPVATEYIPPTVPETLTKWVTILAAATVVGALSFRLFVWLPLTGRGEPTDAARGRTLDRVVTRRLLLLAGGALLVLLLASLVGVGLQVSKVTGGSFFGSFSGGALGDFLLNTRTGAIWLARLLMPLVVGMLLAPVLGAALRRDDGGRDVERVAALGAPLPVALGLAGGIAYLLTLSLISHAAAVAFWVSFTVALDWLHLIGTAVWIGGLIGFALIIPPLRASGKARTLLVAAITRFSKLAVAGPLVLALTGTYSAWLHVGGLDALMQTDYGRALIVKLALFAVLLGFGAFNQRWLLERLAVSQKGDAGAKGGAEAVQTSPRLMRLFGRTVRAEVAIAALLLLVVSLMVGFAPARESLAQARGPQRAQTIVSDGVRVTVTLAALEPGNNSFDVFLRDASTDRPIADAEKVTLRVYEPAMDMGEEEVVTTSRGDGHYAASGSYLSMSGQWDVRVLARRTGLPDIDQSFSFLVGSVANTAADAVLLTEPTLPQVNSTRGIGIIAVVAALFCTIFGVRLFCRGSGFGTALLMLVPTALVVGGYLLSTGEPNEVVINRPAEPANPVVADAASIARGQALFAQNCVVCHGSTGQGDGPSSVSLNPPPPDFSLPHTAYHSDGYLFTAIRDGLPGSAMPAWSGKLTEGQEWDLVNAIRQYNRLTVAGATPPPFNTLPTPTTPAASPTPTITP
jgi:copper transport protein